MTEGTGPPGYLDAIPVEPAGGLPRTAGPGGPRGCFPWSLAILALVLLVLVILALLASRSCRQDTRRPIPGDVPGGVTEQAPLTPAPVDMGAGSLAGEQASPPQEDPPSGSPEAPASIAAPDSWPPTPQTIPSPTTTTVEATVPAPESIVPEVPVPSTGSAAVTTAEDPGEAGPDPDDAPVPPGASGSTDPPVHLPAVDPGIGTPDDTGITPEPVASPGAVSDAGPSGPEPSWGILILANETLTPLAIRLKGPSPTALELQPDQSVDLKLVPGRYTLVVRDPTSPAGRGEGRHPFHLATNRSTTLHLRSTFRFDEE